MESKRPPLKLPPYSSRWIMRLPRQNHSFFLTTRRSIINFDLRPPRPLLNIELKGKSSIFIPVAPHIAMLRWGERGGGKTIEVDYGPGGRAPSVINKGANLPTTGAMYKCMIPKREPRTSVLAIEVSIYWATDLLCCWAIDPLSDYLLSQWIT